MASSAIGLEQIKAAAARIAGSVHKTEVVIMGMLMMLGMLMRMMVLSRTCQFCVTGSVYKTYQIYIKGIDILRVGHHDWKAAFLQGRDVPENGIIQGLEAGWHRPSP